MKIVKKILIILATVIVVLLIAGLFLSKDYAIEKEVTINKPKTAVFNYIKFLKNQDEFSKWAKMDPHMKKDYRGTDATVGFVSMWEGNSDVGKGEQEIKKITDGERIDYDIHFIKPWDSKMQSFLSTEAVSDAQTKVKWGINFHVPYPMNIMCLFGMKDKLGADLQTGLDNLKVIQEKP